ncbi:hypothetical protein Cpir12675_001486 [Ceratocystis pirilliformis]|uniref:Anucleate primary sterigmata protein B n=1 Tax=Ceratocystis pirilliformis TaxID=259994 RepID=A0ABR3ZHI2_9PEZI
MATEDTATDTTDAVPSQSTALEPATTDPDLPQSISTGTIMATPISAANGQASETEGDNNGSGQRQSEINQSQEPQSQQQQQSQQKTPQDQHHHQLPIRPPQNTQSNFSLLPPLPHADELSIMADSRLIGDTMNEDAVRAHLQDVESSFMPEMSPLPVYKHKTADDTFNPSADVVPGSPTPQSRTVPALSQTVQTQAQPSPDHNSASPSVQAPNQQTQNIQNLRVESGVDSDARRHDLDQSRPSPHTPNDPFAVDSMMQDDMNPINPPTKPSFNSSNNYQEREINNDGTRQSNDDGTNEDIDGGENSYIEEDSIMSNRSDYTGRSARQSIDTSFVPGGASRSSKRSKYLRSRNTTATTTTTTTTTTKPIITTPIEATANPNDSKPMLSSPFVAQTSFDNKTQGSESGQDDTDDNASDATIEAGARGSKSVTLAATATLAANSADPSRTIQNAMSVSRSISMASMSSAVDENKMMDQQMGRLGDDGLPLPRIAEAPPTTPKPKTDHLNPPTDTVIARHVRNVQVPDNLVEEYKFKSDLATPRKISESFNLGIGRSAAGKNLTLREQSSTIERLSKENFDLKLKVMFLKDRLDRLSEEGIKQMISENVDLKTTLAITQRDAKTMRKRIKQLEKQLKEEEMQRPSTGRSDSDEDDEAANERQEELIFLRERVEEYVLQIEKLKLEVLNKDSEKRRMSEMVRTLSERAPGESLGRQEETDVWKDLLEQETSRREQADEDNRRLRDELFRLRQQEMNGSLKKITSGQAQGSPVRPTSGLSSEFDRTTLTGSASIVDELRRESEQLRHENAELRREVGAQTSMLTSRNREKERLYQEIEDLKMAQRRGNSAPSTLDSLLDRSASRAGARERSHSRASGTQITAVEEDPDHEELENTIADLRDNLNSLKLQNQEISLELEKCMQDFETAVEARKQSDELILGFQEDMDIAMNDLVALQAERDEALGEQAEMEAEFEALRKEAQEEIDALESEADQHTAEIQRLTVQLAERTENFEALQSEMRQMSEAVVRLEDDAEEKLRRIREMETELESSNKELEDLEHKLLEANEKSNRLGVQQESSAGEIAFLREEQESDKIRIGDLEAALANTQQNLRDEKERVKELDQRLASERRQREIVATKEKEEVQQFVNELNREATTAQDEARRLRKMLTSREVEATEWKERLMELENNLRVALGDLNGTRSSLLKSIANLQRQNEDTIRELDSSKATLVEKERIVKHRDSILESQALETRKLADLLEKERQAHRNTKNAYETFQNTHHHVARTASAMEARIQELEITRSGDKKKIATLEASFKEQVTERNNLLLILWTRLSGLCGTDWAMNNSLINGRALPSVESISTMLPGFSKNLLNAVKTTESMMTKFSARIKSVERDLWREYQALENNLEGRIKKLDRLEMLVRNGIANNSIPPGLASMGAVEMQNRYARLEEAYRQLKVENTTLRTATEVRARVGAGPGTAYTGGSAETAAQVAEIIGGSPSPGIPTGPRGKERNRKMPGLMRPSTSSRSSSSHSPHHHMSGSLVSGIPVPSTSHGHSHRTNSSLGMGMEMVARPETATGHSMAPGMGMADGEGDDTRLILRLKEMEKKLVMEREARNQDRKAARMRLGGLETENRELRSKMKRSDD